MTAVVYPLPDGTSGPECTVACHGGHHPECPHAANLDAAVAEFHRGAVECERDDAEHDDDCCVRAGLTAALPFLGGHDCAERLRHDVQREVDEGFRAAGCKTPAECRDLASAVLGRQVGPGRDAIKAHDVPVLMEVLRAGVHEDKTGAILDA